MMSQSREKSFACVCCLAELPEQGTNCNQCQAPTELSRSVSSRGTEPSFISVLGASGAGKTVYLGMLLDILSKGTRQLKGLPGSAFSVAVQQQTLNALENRQFPLKTPADADSWNWIHSEIVHTARPNRTIDLVTPDLAGEAVALEIEGEGAHPTIQSIVKRSSGLILLFDSQRCRDQSREEDLFAMKLATYVARQKVDERGKLRRRLKHPLAIVFTKADSCSEAADDPAEFARSTTPSLVQACQRHFEQHQFFAAGVVGSMAVAVDGFGRRMQIPLHVQPHGILEPVEWVTDRIP